MKASLEFDLDDPQDKKNHELAIKSQDILSCLITIRNFVRASEKYDAEKISLEKIHEIMSSYDIHL